MSYTVQYYDLVLACIAASLATGAVVGYATAIPFAASVPLLGVVALAFVGHALFVNGPVDDVGDLDGEVKLEEVPKTLSPLEGSN